MTLFDVVEWVAAVMGLSLGALIGDASYGWVGGIIGALIGAPVGWFVGHVPYLAGRVLLHVALRRETVAELRTRLRDEVMWPLFQLVMEELHRRGENVRSELPLVTGLLAAEGARERQRGWEMLRYFFPDVATSIADYDPAEPATRCRAVIERIRHP